MNLIGKIFVVLILVMSLVFMSLAMAVYSTHQNWRDTADKFKADVSTAQTKNNQLREDLKRLDSQLAAERDAYRQQLQALETKRAELEVERNNMQERHAH